MVCIGGGDVEPVVDELHEDVGELEHSRESGGVRSGIVVVVTVILYYFTLLLLKYGVGWSSSVAICGLHICHFV